MTTILHVEEDELLAAAVRSAFVDFGFRGSFLTASGLQEAERLLAEHDREIDLVISDIELGDGSGLDVVRAVRASDVHGHVPILILSGAGDPGTVDRAYALGANSYVTTSTRGRRTSEIVRTIYDHWLQDTRLPVATLQSRTHDVICRAMSLRSRIAQHCMVIAERLGPARGDFWMGVAQHLGNLANLLMFLDRQIEGYALPDDILDSLEAHQKEVQRMIDTPGATPPGSEDESFRYLLALSGSLDTPAFARAVGLLFPASPLAIATMLEAQARSSEAVAAEIEARTSDPALREAAARVRANMNVLRSLRADVGAPAPAAPSDR